MDKSVPRITVWHHSAEPQDDKTMTLGTDLSISTSHSCQILIVHSFNCMFMLCLFVILVISHFGFEGKTLVLVFFVFFLIVV